MGVSKVTVISDAVVSLGVERMSGGGGGTMTMFMEVM